LNFHCGCQHNGAVLMDDDDDDDDDDDIDDHDYSILGFMI